MAKKKLNQEKERNHGGSAMVEASEKIESLKSLNAMLLRETAERRQQVDSLEKAKGSLESELNRACSEEEALRSELAGMREGFLRSGVEKEVAVVFVAQQVEAIDRGRDEIGRKMDGLKREIGEILRERELNVRLKGEKDREVEKLKVRLKGVELEIEREKGFSNGVCLERDEIRDRLEVQINEANELGRKLIEVEQRERFLRGEVEKLRADCDLAVKEKEERESQFETVMKDKGLLEKSLMEANKAVEEMRGKIERIVKEKEGIEKEKNVELRQRNELEKVVSGLDEMLGSLRKEEEILQFNVTELEKKCVESEGKVMEMERGVEELVKEKDEKERQLSKVLEEKLMLEKGLDELSKQLDELKLKVKELVDEKSEIAEAKFKKETQVVELGKQVADLSKTVLGLEESCRVQNEEIMGCESEMRIHRDAIERISIERDEALKGFKEEKLCVVSLKEKIKVMEKNVEDSSKLVEKIKGENANTRKEKEELEKRCNLLENEIASTENELAEARKELHNMKLKLELAGTNAEQILKVLRSTAEMVCENYTSVTLDKEINVEVEPYVAELKAIKHAFKKRETRLEDMKRELVSLKNSVSEAHKKKGFWTVVSSATTLCAAISLAYVARGH